MKLKKGGGRGVRSFDLTDSVRIQKSAVDLDINNWRVLLVNDEPDVHEITRIPLRGFNSSIKSYRDILNIEKKRTKELHKANKELETVVSDLQKALQNVKQLSGLLPICSHCKKILANLKPTVNTRRSVLCLINQKG